ncbi:ribose 5-phosphate isomerase A [Candidatus Roizmanbacteria bacterium RIFCSPLOWO2_02_FULL_37_19]|uniref:Ribose 5-phosphate isomerase A n=1 Tax=Candidatus Roizmanbacteria bacterium RIFCSPHIGHO2_02_FULL_37_24 TaxID=1802037 RepID=A0A1F7GUF6_9BACT|nr:MAG: ribose 5-phosphate isomerase A [Candidatus Roizmanbacteria bacterium RIFCSPHIGHO2_01_FULL_38_41]OGK22650.1 MAG: ribose 5-phosphate isomerase A [Candidatus Roizmanbacteria bacterium RIFCSPHIGHO2_02_FULL_37_24]OGK32500.1 MAG: ribose 5-phosphate isomerase A [Candidatus Roizmanbacteria bacterium RIFCSPHIGHO2_12_FULL_37_23]OGK45115.1 MAG: ribose 5-phosphate isomerase A [Candidatus Roizmanbacteria bacterium RIFCSPLOWO2_01_FULL_37_57]OGK54480.1 MAG: ribose 5-phosphate isomerase A [Candidatus R
MKWKSNITNQVRWSGDISNKEKKQVVAQKIAAQVKNGDIIGIGSGSTSFLALQAIGERVQKENLSITAITTSYEMLITCSALNIPTTTLLHDRPDWSFDGADEVDPNNNLIKGRGGAMFIEKIMIVSAPKTFILVDDTKLVEKLGIKFPVPIEIYPMAINVVEERLMKIGAKEIVLRLAKSKDGPVITEGGNFILDVRFENIGDQTEVDIKKIPGVIESGLFIGYSVEVIST